MESRCPVPSTVERVWGLQPPILALACTSCMTLGWKPNPCINASDVASFCKPRLAPHVQAG